MKTLCLAAFLTVCLLGAMGCSSTPSGTVSVADVIKNEKELLGKNVVVVGLAETQTTMSAFNMFKVYNKGENIWVTFPETASMPPQGMKVRVDGTLKRQKFTAIPEEQLYIEAIKFSLE